MAKSFSVGTTRAPGASHSGASINVDTSSLKALAKDLRKGSPLIAKKLTQRMKLAGQIVADEAKSRASFSTRIPGSIKVRASGASVKVVAGGGGADNASPIENKGAGFVRHPVFGNRAAWTAKNSHAAYLGPALDAKADEVVEAIALAVDDTMRDIGLG